MKRVKTIVPLGYRVLVAPDEIEETSKGGIVLAKDLINKEQGAQVVGTVLDIGADCWADTAGEPWCKVGDRVIFAKYTGMKIWDSVEGKYRNDMLLLNDTDLTARITEEEEVYV